MKKYLFSSLLASSLLFSVAFAAEEHRPFNEMQGDCKNYSSTMQHELAIWNKPSMDLTFSSDVTENPPLLPINSKTIIKLNPENKVAFLVKPTKSFSNPDQSYAGIVKFQIEKSGTYYVSASDKVWFDVVDTKTKQKVAASQFEMQTHCNTMFKIVSFNLEANKNYVLQISSSTKEQTTFLLTKQPNSTQQPQTTS